MNVVKPSVELLDITTNSLTLLETVARTCYQSEPKGDPAGFLRTRIFNSGHWGIFEHAKMTVRMIGSRAMSHQLVRHRHFSFAQESQRYVDYQDGLQVIVPEGLYCDQELELLQAYDAAYEAYKTLREKKVPAQDARFVLPNACKTEIVVTGNFHCWLKAMALRLSPKAQWEIRALFGECKQYIDAALPGVIDWDVVRAYGEVCSKWDKS